MYGIEETNFFFFFPPFFFPLLMDTWAGHKCQKHLWHSKKPWVVTILGTFMPGLPTNGCCMNTPHQNYVSTMPELAFMFVLSKILNLLRRLKFNSWSIWQTAVLSSSPVAHCISQQTGLNIIGMKATHVFYISACCLLHKPSVLY